MSDVTDANLIPFRFFYVSFYSSRTIANHKKLNLIDTLHA